MSGSQPDDGLEEQPDPGPAPAPDPDVLPPEEEAEVAALLGRAAGPIRTPDAVVARLDQVLEGLVAERGADRPADPVAEVAVPERRRRWTRTLLAAAAVVIAGYAGWASLPHQGSGGAASQAGDGVAGPRTSTPAGSSTTAAPSGVVPVLPEVRPGHLRDDLERIVALRSPGARRLAAPRPLRRDCAPRATGSARFGVRYGDTLAVAVLRAPRSGAGGDVVLYDCTGRVLARTPVSLRGR